MPTIKNADVSLGDVYEVLVGGEPEEVEIQHAGDPRLKRGGRGSGWTGKVLRTGKSIEIKSTSKLRRLLRSAPSPSRDGPGAKPLTQAQRALADQNRLHQTQSEIVAASLRRLTELTGQPAKVESFVIRQGTRLETAVSSVATALMAMRGRASVKSAPAAEAFDTAESKINQAILAMQEREEKIQLRAHLDAGEPKRTLAYAFSPEYHAAIGILRELREGRLTPDAATAALAGIVQDEAASKPRGYVLKDWLRELGTIHPAELIAMSGYVSPDKLIAIAVELEREEPGVLPRMAQEMIARSHDPANSAQVLEEAAYADEQRGEALALPAAVTALKAKPADVIKTTLAALKKRAPELVLLTTKLLGAEEALPITEIAIGSVVTGFGFNLGMDLYRGAKGSLAERTEAQPRCRLTRSPNCTRASTKPGR